MRELTVIAGFWIPDNSYKFQCLSVELGFWIPIELSSGFQSQGFWIPEKISRIPKSGFPYIGRNRPFPSSPGPLFQSEGRCSAFDMEIIFHSHANKTHFHKKGCAPSLILKVKVFGTRMWPILFILHEMPLFPSLTVNVVKEIF